MGFSIGNLLASVQISAQLNTLELRMVPPILHERQRLQLCLKHALNNLLQVSSFSCCTCVHGGW
jgi:hypothetical protein